MTSVIIAVVAAVVTTFIVVTAFRFGEKGLGGALEGILAAIVVAAILSVLVLPGVDWIYARQKSEIPGTQMFRDISSSAGAVISVFSGGETQGNGPSWDQPAQPQQPTPSQPPPQQPTQPQPPPQPPAQPAPQQQPAPQPPAQPAPQLLPQEKLGRCWLEAVIKDGIQSAETGGASWFPAGISCSVSEDKRFLRKNLFFVTCLELGLQELQVTRTLGKQLQSGAGPGGSFYGTGSWPPSCYYTAQPEPDVSGCPAGMTIPAGTAGYYVGTPPDLQVEGGLFNEQTTLTGVSVPFGGLTLCQTTHQEGNVWVWFP